MLRIIRHLKDSFDRSNWQADDPSPSHPAGFSNCSNIPIRWVLPGKLAVGGFPGGGDGIELTRGGIRSILSLCDEWEGILPESIVQNFECLRFPLPDSRYPDPIEPEQLVTVVNLIHRRLENRFPVYVHCLAGVERSPTVCIAYLCRHCNLELWEAVNWLKQVNPRSSPASVQTFALRQFVDKYCQVKRIDD